MHDAQLVRRYVFTVGPQMSVAEASRMMMRHGLASLVVIDGRGQVRGIITESDIVRAVSDGRDFELTNVGSVMTRNPITVGEDVTADQAALAMCRSRARHLPVTRGGRLVGMVFDRDLIRKMRKDVYAHQPAEYV